MFFRRRQEIAQLEAREAEGQSFWASTFDDRLRTKFVHLVKVAGRPWSSSITESARQMILIDEGLFHLHSAHANAEYDFIQSLLSGPDDLIPTLLEAWWAAAKAAQRSGYQELWSAASDFEDAVNRLLAQHRVSFEMVEGQMVRRESQELHATVIVPTLRLLAGRGGWERVESAYQDALKELGDGSPSDAITDAGTALQEALEKLGCSGNQLGDLIRDGKKRGLFGPHDAKLTQSIADLAHWVSSDRSTLGDAHHSTDANPDDAWLTVHVVGALILRLTGENARGAH